MSLIPSLTVTRERFPWRGTDALGRLGAAQRPARARGDIAAHTARLGRDRSRRPGGVAADRDASIGRGGEGAKSRARETADPRRTHRGADRDRGAGHLRPSAHTSRPGTAYHLHHASLAEVFEIADRVTVLRDGKVALAGQPCRQSQCGGCRHRDRRHAGRPSGAATLSSLASRCLRSKDSCGTRFGPIDLTVAAGEVVGLFGALGSGRTELLETIFGSRRPTQAGILVGGRPIDPSKPAAAIAEGIALVPADRLRQALFGELDAVDNVLLPSYRPAIAIRVSPLAARAPIVRGRSRRDIVSYSAVAPARPPVVRRHAAEADRRTLAEKRKPDLRADDGRADAGRRRRHAIASCTGSSSRPPAGTAAPCCSSPRIMRKSSLSPIVRW